VSEGKNWRETPAKGALGTEVLEHGEGTEWVKHRRRSRRALRVVLACVAAFLVLVAAASVWIDFQVNPPSGAGSQVTISLPTGSSYSAAADILARNGVIGSSTLFRLYVRVHGAGTVEPGTYTLRKHESYGDVVGALGRGPTVDRLTITSGTTVADVATKVGRLPGHSAAGFQAAVNSGSVRSAFEPAGTTNLEGLIQPATFSFTRGTDDLTVLRQMVGDFDAQATAVGLNQPAPQLKITPYQAVIVASLIEREAKAPEDLGRVARVIYNRLAKNQLLQLDSTVVYALGGHVSTLSTADLGIASPYNTYRVIGLPPTPIAIPSEASLKAALNPTPGPWLYFVVVSQDGGEAFSTTLAEQNHNIALAHQRGLR
jgi:UPF0755 protein